MRPQTVKKEKTDSLIELCNKVRSSNIDFSKLGSVNQVADIIKISHQKVGGWMNRNLHAIYRNAYKRKTTKRKKVD